MHKTLTEYTSGAALFQLLAHPARLHILDELRRGAACVCHLQTVLHRPQAYVSQQLRVLREAEVVSDEKDSLNVYYRLSDARLAQLLDIVLGPAQAARQIEGCSCPRCASPQGATPEECCN